MQQARRAETVQRNGGAAGADHANEAVEERPDSAGPEQGSNGLPSSEGEPSGDSHQRQLPIGEAR